MANFSALLKQAQALGRTTDSTTKATDVTGQYVDLQARIAAVEASRQAYLAILAKATSVGDVLSVQEQLDTIQQQIEQLQGQLQVLTDTLTMLTVHLLQRVRRHRARSLAPVGARAGVARQHWRLRRRRGGRGRVAGPVLFDALASPSSWWEAERCGAATSGTTAAAVPQKAIAAANGRPGITTPMWPEGPTSSLTAIGPPACTMMGSSPAAVSACRSPPPSCRPRTVPP